MSGMRQGNCREASPGASDGGVRFEPVRDDHMPQLRAWLGTPHVRAWWGDPDVELELIRRGRETGESDGYVVRVDGEPVGYAQSWPPEAFQSEEWIAAEPWLARLPSGVIGVDLFIGSPDHLGRGLGSVILRSFCDVLAARGHAHIIIDPDVRNARAIATYLKAGFTPIAGLEGATGNSRLLEWRASPMQRTE